MPIEFFPKGRDARTKRRILVVSGDSVTRRLVEVNLARQGYDIGQAGSGRMGLELVESCRPDLIVLDDVLPDMADGYAFLILLFANPQNRSIKVIRVTRRAEDSDTFRGGGGADAYLVKPFNPMELIAFVRRLCQQEDDGGRGVWHEIFKV